MMIVGGGGLFILATFQIFASFAKKEKKNTSCWRINKLVRGLGGAKKFPSLKLRGRALL